MASTSKPLANWLELPPDVMINILHRVCVIDIFENVQKVCTKWHKICKTPDMWRVLHMESPYLNDMSRFKVICKLAVDRSQGQLVDLTFVDLGDGELLQYVADRSSQLRCLEIAYCLDSMLGSWNEALKKFPLLEELNLYSTDIPKEAIETVGRYCPMLKTLKVNQREHKYWFYDDVKESIMIGNEFAKAIGGELN